MKADQPTYVRRLMDERGLNQSQLAEMAGVTRQEVNRAYKGTRQVTVSIAKRLAPHLGVAWYALVADDAGQEPAPAVEHRVAVRKVPPVPGEPLNNPDEIALVGMFRSLSLVKQAALFAYLGADDMPSLRRDD